MGVDKQAKQDRIKRMKLNVTEIANNGQLNGMVAALRKVPTFTVEKTKTTVIVTHTKAGEVFRALAKDSTGSVWIIRRVENLWS
jgi:hypothetical protein